MPGFRGNYTVLDRKTGKGMLIGFWDSEEAIQASMAMHQEAHERFTQQGLWTAPPTIEVMEVVGHNPSPQ